MSTEEYVDRQLEDWPPLTDEQLDRIAVLLRGSSEDVTVPLDEAS